MEQRHREYLEYYEARMKKWEGDKDYPNTYAAEKAIYDALAACATLEEFKDKLDHSALNTQVAVALVKDQAKLRSDFYLSLNEPVRAGASLEILKNLEENSYDNVLDLNTMVTDVETRWQIKIAMDETLIEEFHGSWKILEDIEEYEFAQVPERWAEERRGFVARDLGRERESWENHTIPNALKMDPNYKPDVQELYEPRHRRKILFDDGLFQRRVAGFRRATGV